MEPRTLEQLQNEAMNGDGQACYELYEEYKKGIHVDENEAAALDWLERAIDCNHPMAQLVMGLSMLNRGNISDAIEYLNLACLNHSADAMFILSQLYLGNVEKITIEEPDPEKGIELLMQSASLGDVRAQILLGKCFYVGKWVTKNAFLSSYYLELARNQGSDEADQLLDEVHRIVTDLN